MTFSLEHVENEHEGSVIACVVRQEDGVFLSLHDTNTLMELKSVDPDGYELVLAMVRKLLSVSSGRLLA